MDEINPRRGLSILLVLLLAFGLRIHQLDAYPLWWDEGITLTFSRLSLAENIALTNLTQDVNPPVYRWVVGGFTAVTGTSVFTTRLPTVYAGLIVVAVTAAVGRRVFNRRVGWLAGLLMACSPMAVYYAQEAKGYSFVAAALMLGVWVWWHLHRWLWAEDPTLPAPAAYLAMTPVIACAVGAHYFAGLGVISLNLLAVGASWRYFRRAGVRGRLLRHWGGWLGGQALGGLVLMPFAVPTLLASSRFDTVAPPPVNTTLLGQIWNVLATFGAGVYATTPLAALLTVLLLALAGVGLAHQKAGVWGAAVWLGFPLLFGFGFTVLYPWFFERLPRFLLYTQPALVMLAAVGLVALAERWPRWALPVGAAALLGLSLPMLGPVYGQPTWPEDVTWPPLYEDLATYTQPGDIVFASLVWMPGYMYAYLPPETQPPWLLTTFDDVTVETELNRVTAAYERIWYITYERDPLAAPLRTSRWMSGRAAVPYSKVFETGTLTLYEPVGAVSYSGQARFAEGIELAWGAPPVSARAGDSVAVALQWRIEAAVAADYIRFLHVIDSNGQLVAQTDRQPVAGSAPTYTWPPGEPISDPVGVLLPPDLPPGAYQLRVGLYDAQTLERLPVEGGDHVVVGTIHVGDDDE